VKSGIGIDVNPELTTLPAPLPSSASPFAESQVVPNISRGHAVRYGPKQTEDMPITYGPRVSTVRPTTDTPTPISRTTQEVVPARPEISDGGRVTMSQEEEDFARNQGLTRPEIRFPVPRVSTVGHGFDMTMTPSAAMRFAHPVVMRVAQGVNETAQLQAMRSTPEGRRALQSKSPVEFANMRAQWAEAERRARLGAMSPQQRAWYMAAENAVALQDLNLYRQSPQAVEAEANRQRDISVARARAEGEARRTMGPAELQAKTASERAKQEAEIAKAGMTAEERRAQAEMAGKKSTAEEARRARELTTLSDSITRLYASLAGIQDPSSPAVAAIQKRIGQLEMSQNKLLGIETETEQIGPIDKAARGKQLCRQANALFGAGTPQARAWYEAEVAKLRLTR